MRIQKPEAEDFNELPSGIKQRINKAEQIEKLSKAIQKKDSRYNRSVWSKIYQGRVCLDHDHPHDPLILFIFTSR